MIRRIQSFFSMCVIVAISCCVCNGASLGDDKVTNWTSGVHHLVFDGKNRTFILDVPGDLKPNSPLVMVFHGYGGSAKDIQRKVAFKQISEKYGFVVVYPDGTRDSKDHSFFQVGYEFDKDRDVDDVSFARQLAERLVQDLKLDTKSVFATGFSNGGDMSYLLGCRPDPFVRAIAPVAGTMMVCWDAKLQPGSRVPVLAVNARDDTVTRWNGDMQNRDGWGAYFGTESVIDFWVRGLTLENSKTDQITKVIQRRVWSTKTDTTEFQQFEFSVGGHDWPNNLGDKAVSTAEEIWRFFDSHRPRP